MRESPIFHLIRQSHLYQRTLGEGVKVGELRQARELLIRLGTRRFGDANPSTIAALEMIQDVERLEALNEKMIEPELRDWDDLFRGYSSPPDEPNLSSTCEKILREGREMGRLQVTRRLLRHVGARRFGEPNLETARKLLAIDEIGQLETLAEHLVDDDLESWTDLLNEASA